MPSLLHFGREMEYNPPKCKKRPSSFVKGVKYTYKEQILKDPESLLIWLKYLRFHTIFLSSFMNTYIVFIDQFLEL